LTKGFFCVNIEKRGNFSQKIFDKKGGEIMSNLCEMDNCKRSGIHQTCEGDHRLHGHGAVHTKKISKQGHDHLMFLCKKHGEEDRKRWKQSRCNHIITLGFENDIHCCQCDLKIK